MLTIIWGFKKTCSSNIKDHWSQVIKNIIIMKKFEILRITKMQQRDIKWANAIGKMVLMDVLDSELPQMFNLPKKKKNCTICEAQ